MRNKVTGKIPSPCNIYLHYQVSSMIGDTNLDGRAVVGIFLWDHWKQWVEEETLKEKVQTWQEI